MTAIELKNSFHHLIDSIENEGLLQKFYELMLRKKTSKDGALWSKLSGEEIGELLAANDESADPSSLVSHEEMKKKHFGRFKN